MIACMTLFISRRTTLKAAAGTASGTAFAGSPAARAATDGPILKPLPARCFVDFGTNAETVSYTHLTLPTICSV